MNKNYLLLLIAFCSGSVFAQSPITLGNSNMPGNGDTLRYTNIQLSSLGNYQQTGTSFSWNFSNVISTTEGVRSFKSGLQTPYAIFFLSLNEYGEKIADTIGIGPVALTKYYNYYKKQTSPNAFIADGAGVTFSSVPLPSYYSDKDELYNFPMSYPKYDSTTFKFSTLSTTLIPIRYSKTGYRVTKVDGWGTITTPYGTASCLRLVTTQYGMDSLKTTIGPVTIPIGFPNVQRSYQWFTINSKIPYLEVTGTLIGTNFTPAQARYRGYNIPPSVDTGINEAGKQSAITLYPNPVNDFLYLNFENQGANTYTLYDSQGKLLNIVPVSTASATINVSALPAGIYFIKTLGDDRVECFKFSKQ